MLQQHELNCSVLPAIYANKSHVALAFARLVRIQRVLSEVARQFAEGALHLPLEGGWGVFEAF